MRRLDTDGDGQLSRRELASDQAQQYAGADTNRDGSIDPSELAAAIAREDPLAPSGSLGESDTTGGALP
jgi:hypothetical protein